MNVNRGAGTSQRQQGAAPTSGPGDRDDCGFRPCPPIEIRRTGPAPRNQYDGSQQTRNAAGGVTNAVWPGCGPFPCPPRDLNLSANDSTAQQADTTQNRPEGPSDQWNPPPTYNPLSFGGRRQTESAQQRRGKGPDFQRPPGYPRPQDQRDGCQLNPLRYHVRRQNEAATQDQNWTEREQAGQSCPKAQKQCEKAHQDQCLILIPKPVPTWKPPNWD